MTTNQDQTPNPEEQKQEPKRESLFWRLFPLTPFLLVACVVIVQLTMLHLAPKKWSIIQDKVTGEYGYISWSKKPVYGYITCEGAKLAADKDKAWSEEFDKRQNELRKNRKPEPKPNPYRLVDVEKECK